MTEIEPLRKELAETQDLLAELIDVVRQQAKQLEQFAILVDQQTDLRDFPQELPIVVSRLSALHRRMQKLRQVPDEVPS
jgi:Mg2+ and Co2+ transporter CorA